MDINVIGGGWILAENFGRMRTGKIPPMVPGTPALPPAGAVFTRPPARYGRFDPYTRLGCAAMALALTDAGLDLSEKPRPVGIIVSSIYDCFETDIAFYETTREAEGIYASPNLFSYTLPGIVIGETAIQFGLTGPTFTVGDAVDARGYTALKTSAELIGGGLCDTVVAGWVDCETTLLKRRIEADDNIRGAVFVVLSSRYRRKRIKKIKAAGVRLQGASGERIRALADLFS